jgi:hypothetical protein
MLDDDAGPARRGQSRIASGTSTGQRRNAPEPDTPAEQHEQEVEGDHTGRAELGDPSSISSRTSRMVSPGDHARTPEHRRRHVDVGPSVPDEGEPCGVREGAGRTAGPLRRCRGGPRPSTDRTHRPPNGPTGRRGPSLPQARSASSSRRPQRRPVPSSVSLSAPRWPPPARRSRVQRPRTVHRSPTAGQGACRFGRSAARLSGSKASGGTAPRILVSG